MPKWPQVFNRVYFLANHSNEKLWNYAISGASDFIPMEAPTLSLQEEMTPLRVETMASSDERPDIFHGDDGVQRFLLKLSLPGFLAEDIQVVSQGNALQVIARSSRQAGQLREYCRQFTVPLPISPASLNAVFCEDVLTVQGNLHHQATSPQKHVHFLPTRKN